MTRRPPTETSIHEVTRLTATTSRTLRHYDAIGLLEPTGVDHGGMRWYDAAALRRLQRILLLRELGLGLPQIAVVLDRTTDPVEALETHLRRLADQRDLLDRRTASVRRTLTALREGKDLMADQMMDGFDHTEHKDEVEERWGAGAYATTNAWWSEMSPQDRARRNIDQQTLAADWTAAAEAGTDPASKEAQALAERHAAWLAGFPGTPGAGGEPVVEYVVGLGEMYVTDERFAVHYGGVDGARFVRDTLQVWADSRAGR